MQDGGPPYGTKSNADVLHELVTGNRHPKPSGCPDAVFVEVSRCWLAAPESRPTFRDLVAIIGTMIPGATVDSVIEEQSTDYIDVSAIYHPGVALRNNGM